MASTNTQHLTFSANLQDLSRKNRRAEAIDLALEYLDGLLAEGRADDLELTMHTLNPERLATSIVVSILGITRKANHSPARQQFFALSMKYITRLKGPRYASELLAKYR